MNTKKNVNEPLPASDLFGDWVPCSQSLPADQLSVLVVSEHGKKVVMYRESGVWVEGLTTAHWEPTHWTPLPPSPNVKAEAPSLSEVDPPAAGSLVVAFDIDGTWSLDPPAWRKIYDMLYDGRWQPIIVTGSKQPDDKMRRLLVPVDAIVIVSGPLLKEEAARRAGYKVAVWIDDMPGMIQSCRILGGDLDSENKEAHPPSFSEVGCSGRSA